MLANGPFHINPSWVFYGSKDKKNKMTLKKFKYLRKYETNGELF
jgi:hypothetical protein